MRACGRIAILALAAVAVLSADAEARHRHRHYRHHRGFDMALPAETSPDRERSPRFDVVCGRRHCRVVRERRVAPSDLLSDLGDLIGACNEMKRKFAPEVTDEVARQVKPTDTQRQAFSDFQLAATAAMDMMRAGCSATISRDAMGRLDEASN